MRKKFSFKKRKRKKICNDFNGILVGASLMTLLTVTVVHIYIILMDKRVILKLIKYIIMTLNQKIK